MRTTLQQTRQSHEEVWQRALTASWPACLCIAVAALTASPAGAQTLKAVKDRGALICGVSEGLYGFSARDDKGAWSGFDVDLCRALAAAIFNDASKVQFRRLDASDRFEALQSGSIDVLSRNSTWTMSRETELGLSFAGDHLTTTARASWCRSAEEGLRARARRRQGLRADRHHHRAQSRRLFPHQQDEVRGDRRPQPPTKRSRATMPGAATCSPPTSRSSHASGCGCQARRSRHPAGRHLQGAARPGGAAGRRAMVQHRASGCTSPCSMPRSSA